MKCEQVKGSLSAYLDSQLALEERHAIATHLQTCTDCSNALADFCYLDALLSRLPRVAPDASLRQRIFSSAEYKEITGTFNLSASVSNLTVSAQRVRLYDPTRPYLIALPGGQLGQPTSPAFPIHRPIPLSWYIFYRRINGLRAIHLLFTAILLLTIGVSGFIASTHILVVNMQTTKASRPLSIQGLATALSWSASLPNQLVIALSDGQQGIYLVDTLHNTSLQLDSSNARSPILWTQIP